MFKFPVKSLPKDLDEYRAHAYYANKAEGWSSEGNTLNFKDGTLRYKNDLLNFVNYSNSHSGKFFDGKQVTWIIRKYKKENDHWFVYFTIRFLK